MSLPIELHKIIINFMNRISIHNLRHVSHYWYSLIKSIHKKKLWITKVIKLLETYQVNIPLGLDIRPLTKFKSKCWRKYNHSGYKYVYFGDYLYSRYKYGKLYYAKGTYGMSILYNSDFDKYVYIEHILDKIKQRCIRKKYTKQIKRNDTRYIFHKDHIIIELYGSYIGFNAIYKNDLNIDYICSSPPQQIQRYNYDIIVPKLINNMLYIYDIDYIYCDIGIEFKSHINIKYNYDKEKLRYINALLIYPLKNGIQYNDQLL